MQNIHAGGVKHTGRGPSRDPLLDRCQSSAGHSVTCGPPRLHRQPSYDSSTEIRRQKLSDRDSTASACRARPPMHKRSDSSRRTREAEVTAKEGRFSTTAGAGYKPCSNPRATSASSLCWVKRLLCRHHLEVQHSANNKCYGQCYGRTQIT